MQYDSNDISPDGWVKTECKTMVNFKYKSTMEYGFKLQILKLLNL